MAKPAKSRKRLRVLVVAMERTEYTLDLVQNIFIPREVEVVFADDLRWWQVFGLLKSHDGFVVNSYSHRKCVALLLLNALFYRKPLAIDADSQPRSPRRMSVRFLKWCWLKFLFQFSWCWGFACGTGCHRDFFLGYGLPDSRLRLMPLVVHCRRYQRGEGALRQNRQTCFRVGYLGRLVPHKKVDVLIDAFSRARKEPGFPASELLIVGDGLERAWLENAARGVPVRFAGWLSGEEKIGALHSLDCLVLPSSYEPWGLVVNEALSSGVPVIVSEAVGARHDLVEGHHDDRCGIVVPIDDVKSLSAAICQLAQDAELRQRMGAAGVRRMRNWDYELYAKCFDSWMEGLN